MNQNLKHFIKALPLIKGYYKKKRLKNKYEIERLLIKGKHINTNAKKSIIYFSFHKAATQYIKTILRNTATKCNIIPVKIEDYAWDTKFPFLFELSEKEMESYQHIFKPNGYLYGPFHAMVKRINNLDKYKILFITRDPRDILVSEYYSEAYSHVIPNKYSNKRKAMIQRRKTALNMTIDEYALKEVDNKIITFNVYKDLLLRDHNNIFFSSYEKMLSDFESWLKELFEYCDFEVNDEYFTSIIKNFHRNQHKKDNKNMHYRKGSIGDYSEKLHDETISKLNTKLKSVLDFYGYN